MRGWEVQGLEVERFRVQKFGVEREVQRFKGSEVETENPEPGTQNGER